LFGLTNRAAVEKTGEKTVVLIANQIDNSLNLNASAPLFLLKYILISIS
jgi:hypothetical protein